MPIMTGVERHLRSRQIWHHPRGRGGQTPSPPFNNAQPWLRSWLMPWLAAIEWETCENKLWLSLVWLLEEEGVRSSILTFPVNYFYEVMCPALGTRRINNLIMKSPLEKLLVSLTHFHTIVETRTLLNSEIML